METVLTSESIEHLKSILCTKEKYIEIVSNLQKIGFGLVAITERNPELKVRIQPQINAIKLILGALRHNESYEIAEWIRCKTNGN